VFSPRERGLKEQQALGDSRRFVFPALAGVKVSWFFC
jgi:hypothetical protein